MEGDEHPWKRLRPAVFDASTHVTLALPKGNGKLRDSRYSPTWMPTLARCEVAPDNGAGNHLRGRFWIPESNDELGDPCQHSPPCTTLPLPFLDVVHCGAVTPNATSGPTSTMLWQHPALPTVLPPPPKCLPRLFEQPPSIARPKHATRSSEPGTVTRVEGKTTSERQRGLPDDQDSDGESTAEVERLL